MLHVFNIELIKIRNIYMVLEQYYILTKCVIQQDNYAMLVCTLTDSFVEYMLTHIFISFNSNNTTALHTHMH